MQRGLTWSGSQFTLAPVNGLGFAVFGVADTGDMSRVGLVANNGTGGLWVFVSDFATGQWSFLNYVFNRAAYTLPAGTYFGSAKTIYVAIVCPADSGYTGDLSFLYATDFISPPPDTPDDAPVPPELSDNYQAIIDHVSQGGHPYDIAEQGNMADRRAYLYYVLQEQNVVLSKLTLTNFLDVHDKLGPAGCEFALDANGSISSQDGFGSLDAWYVELPSSTRGQLAWFGEQILARYPDKVLLVYPVTSGGPPP